METENQKDLDQIGIGTKESETLKPKTVKVTGHRIEPVTKKDTGKEIGNKVILICKHPDREDPIELSKVKYLKGDKVTTSGLWINQDTDGLIPKQSALALTMNKYGCQNVSDFDGKDVETDLDSQYLVVKAY